MYGLRVITGPATEPVTLAEIRAQAHIDHSLEDPVLAGYLLSARQYLEGVTGRAFITQTLELTMDNFPAGEIVLPRGPVASITSITYLDTAGASQTVASYVLDGYSLPPRLVPAYGESWPSTRGTPGNVAIRFVAGQAEAPLPIRQALLLMIAHWNENRESPGANPTVDSLIAPYRIWI